MPNNGGKGGRPKKPPHLHLVEGTHRPDRHGPKDAVQPLNPEPPKPPEFMSVRGAEVFDGLCGILKGMGLLTADHTIMLWLLASRIEECEQHQAIVEDLGYTFMKVSATTQQLIPTIRPEARLRSDAFRHLQSLLSEFGLSPAALGKVSTAKAPPKNDFADFA